MLCWALEHYFPDATIFFEIGCGTGFVLVGIGKALPRLTLGGGEVSSVGLRLAADRVPGVDLFQMDARQIPFENQFDVIGAFDVLEHMGDDELVLLASVLGSAPMGWYSSNRFAAFLPLEQDR